MVTTLPRVTVDVELLMRQLLAYDGLTVEPRVDVESLDTLPLLAYVCGNGRMIRNGFPAAGWEWTLYLSLFVHGMAGGNALADTVYQLVHGMEGRLVVGVGAVVGVEDVSMFDRVGAAELPDKRVVQYTATFTVTVRPVAGMA